MSLNVSKKGGDFEKVPPGLHLGTCFLVVDLGTQPSKNPLYQPKSKVMIGWELDPATTGLREDGSLHITFAHYTASLSENAFLTAHLQSWRGRPFSAAELELFNLENIVRAPAYLQMMLSDDGKYCNVNNVLPVPPGLVVPPLTHEVQVFNLDAPNMDQFNKLGDNTKQKILQSPEAAACGLAAMLGYTAEPAAHSQVAVSVAPGATPPVWQQPPPPVQQAPPVQPVQPAPVVPPAQPPTPPAPPVAVAGAPPTAGVKDLTDDDIPF